MKRVLKYSEETAEHLEVNTWVRFYYTYFNELSHLLQFSLEVKN